MARSSKPTRVHTTNPRTIGGGLEWKDMFPLPNSIWVVILTLKAIFRHFFGLVIGVITFVWFVDDWSTFGFWNAVIRAAFTLMLIFLVMLLVLLLVVYLRYSYAPTIKRLFVALMRWWTLRRHWAEACANAGFRKLPKYKKLRFTPNGLTIHTRCGKKGITPNDFRAGADEIVGMLEAHEMKVESRTPAYAILHIVWGDPTSRVLLPGDLTGMAAVNDEETAVVFSLDPDHNPVEVPLNVPVLICGESDSGKSNALWSILNGLLMRGIKFRLRIIDPAGGVELQELEESSLTLDYAGRITGAEALIARAHSFMEERLAYMRAQSITKWTPDMAEEMPLDILVIDEMLYMKKYDSHSLFGQRLAGGRKAGCIVIGLSQLSQKDALGETRDLFPVRMCHSTKSTEMTDTALGPDAEKHGAKCSQISKATPGVGYIYDQETRSYVRFRTPLVSNSDRLRIANEDIVTTVSYAVVDKVKKLTKLDFRKTSVYKFFTYDAEHGYTGMTWNFEKRRNQHADKSWWFDQIDEELTEIEEYPRRKDAKVAETWSIKNERPLFNKRENEDNPDRVDRVNV